jgi:oxygen-dependent protoporphyrinogen oxidase
MDTNVVIIGAGIAGLAAGYQLKKAGCDSIILEALSFVGGRMSSEECQGFIIDKAAYTFPDAHRNLHSFIQALGFRDHLVPTSGTTSTLSGGREYQIKIGSPMDFLKYKLLTGRSKRDMIKLFLYAQSLGKTLDMGQPTSKTFALERQSAAEYLLESFDEEILEKIAYPIFSEVFLGIPEQNSKLAFLATIKNLTRFKIFAFPEGMGLIPERLMRELDVRLNSPVLKISPATKEGLYEVHVGGENPRSYLAEGVIAAVPLPLVIDIADGLPEDVLEGFRNVRYAPSIVTALAVDREYPATSMINNLLRKNNRVVATIIFDHHKSPHRIPQGKSLVTAILCEPASRMLFTEPDGKITEAVLEDMDRLYPGFVDRLIFSKVYRWPHGAVQLMPGSVRQQHELRKILTGIRDNLLFAGDGLYKSSLEISFNTGVEAANRIMARLARTFHE